MSRAFNQSTNMTTTTIQQTLWIHSPTMYHQFQVTIAQRIKIQTQQWISELLTVHPKHSRLHEPNMSSNAENFNNWYYQWLPYLTRYPSNKPRTCDLDINQTHTIRIWEHMFVVPCGRCLSSKNKYQNI